jgi:hypothetical protein
MIDAGRPRRPYCTNLSEARWASNEPTLTGVTMANLRFARAPGGAIPARWHGPREGDEQATSVDASPTRGAEIWRSRPAEAEFV